MTFINITENGSGRIHFYNTPTEISGLAIKGLETCTGIVILGSEGISAIHDEGYLSIASIKEEFKIVGTLRGWSIFYNPNMLKGEELKNRQKEMAPIIAEYAERFFRYDGSNPFCASPSGCLSVSRLITDIFEVKTDLLPDSMEPRNKSLRNAVRRLNNMYVSYTKEVRTVPTDIQFDGINQTEPSRLICEDRNQLSDIINYYFVIEPKVCQEYKNYLTEAIPSGVRASFQPISAETAFDELEKSYEKTKDPSLLHELVNLAESAFNEMCRISCYEGAEDYENKIKRYLSEIDRIKREAIVLNSSSSPSSSSSSSPIAERAGQPA